MGMAFTAKGVPTSISVGAYIGNAAINLLPYKVAVIRRTVRFMAVCAGQDLILIDGVIR